MMNFRKIKTAIINTIGLSANGQFITAGFQRQQIHSDQTQDASRIVQVFYSAGDFRKKSGGSLPHEITFQIDLTVSKAAEGDLTIIDNPISSSGAIAIALAAFVEASQLADESMDELFDAVYQIIMDARNIEFGLGKGILSDRYLTGFKKDMPISRGSLVSLTGSALLTIQTVEAVTGAYGIAATDYNVTIDIKDDDIERTGIAGTFER